MRWQALRVVVVAFFTFMAASVSHGQSISTIAPNNGSGGIFLDLTPVGGSLNLNTFATYFSSAAGTSVNVEVWTRPGTYVGSTTSSVGWTLSETVTATSAGTATLSAPVTLAVPILLPAGSTTAVYFHAVTAGGGIRYTGTGTTAVTTYSNSEITLFSSVARTGAVAFAGTANTPRCFAGTLEYSSANPNAMGACCTATALCTVDSPIACSGAGGFFSGDGTTCNPNVCPHRGACCSSATNACTFSNNGAAGCGANSTYQGDATSCNPNICPQGACCNGATGVCTLTAPTGCLAGSTYQSNGTTCTPTNPCPQPPPPANDLCINAQALTLNVAVQATNAFATGDGSEGPGGACYTTSPTNFNRAVWYTFTPPATTNYLVSLCGTTFDSVLSIFSTTPTNPCDNLTEIACDDDTCIGTTDIPFPGPGPGSALASLIPSTLMTGGQTYYIRPSRWTTTGAGGPLGIIVQFAAGVTIGSCCVSTTCTLTDAANCTGTYTDGGTCTPSPCGGPAGVCCRGATCSTTIADSTACTASLIGGQFAGASFPAAAGCNSVGVSNTPCCYGDYNKVGGITVGDIFDFLGDWFAGSPYANTGGNGSAGPLAVQNIFDFLSAWFAGGC